MAVIINKRGKTLPLSTPGQAGQATERIETFELNEAVNAADIVEITGLPAHMKPTECTVETEGLAGPTNITVGLMTGHIYEANDARTLGSEFVAAASAGSVNTTSVTDLAGISKSTEHRGIGFQLSANEAAGAAKRVHIRIRYIS